VRAAPHPQRELRLAERARWGQRPNTEPAQDTERPRMRLLAWRPLQKGALRGFASVQLPIGLQIEDCPVYVGRNGPWATLPSRPMIDGDGRHKRDTNGKPQYSAILKWRDRDLQSRFSDTLIALFLEQSPAALDDGGAP
jgi:hypothetical protein